MHTSTGKLVQYTSEKRLAHVKVAEGHAAAFITMVFIDGSEVEFICRASYGCGPVELEWRIYGKNGNQLDRHVGYPYLPVESMPEKAS